MARGFESLSLRKTITMKKKNKKTWEVSKKTRKNFKTVIKATTLLMNVINHACLRVSKSKKAYGPATQLNNEEKNMVLDVDKFVMDNLGSTLGGNVLVYKDDIQNKIPSCVILYDVCLYIAGLNSEIL